MLLESLVGAAPRDQGCLVTGHGPSVEALKVVPEHLRRFWINEIDKNNQAVGPSDGGSYYFYYPHLRQNLRPNSN